MSASIKGMVFLAGCILAMGACGQGEEPTGCEGGACVSQEEGAIVEGGEGEVDGRGGEVDEVAADEVAADGGEGEVDERGEALNGVGVPPAFKCLRHIFKPGAASCQYYACRDSIQSCGPEGYWLGLGGPFCEFFSNVIRPQMSPFGKVWVDLARTCLQVEAHKIPTTTSCGEVFQENVDAHPGCWLKSGYCFLSPAEKEILANLPVGPEIAAIFDAFIQEINETCEGHLPRRRAFAPAARAAQKTASGNHMGGPDSNESARRP